MVSTLSNGLDLTDSKKIQDDRTRFLHASDTHLGAAQYWNEVRSDDFIDAFQEILDISIKKKVDFIILGGDVFTSLEILPGKLTKIIAILRYFKIQTYESVPIIAIEGNHDIRKFSRGVRFEKRGQSWLKLLASLGLIVLLDADLEAPPDLMFKPYDFLENKGGKIRIKDVMVYGTRYLSQTETKHLDKVKKALNNDDGLFHVLIQHFGIQGQMENVPGVKYREILELKDNVHYLALGHFHKQFIINNWIYNPGSSEAACSSDHMLNRGIFFVEVSKSNPYIKRVEILNLKNRQQIRETIFFRTQFSDPASQNQYLINVLKSRLDGCHRKFNPEYEECDLKKPLLYLYLRGVQPQKSCRINNLELRKLLRDALPILDVKIYQKFEEQLSKIDKFL